MQCCKLLLSFCRCLPVPSHLLEIQGKVQAYYQPETVSLADVKKLPKGKRTSVTGQLVKVFITYIILYVLY